MSELDTIHELKHIKVITTEVYTDGLKSLKKEYSQNIQTSRNSVMGDLIACLDVLTDGSSDEVIIIVKAKHQQPELIVKTWTASNERYR
jgi:hypothetical protein